MILFIEVGISYPPHCDEDVDHHVSSETSTLLQKEVAINNLIQQTLYKKWFGQLGVPGGKHFHIRLPNSNRIQCCISSEDSAKVLDTN